MKKGDIAAIFTPDDTHFEIAKECIENGLHVLITKPSVKSLAHHQELVDLARKNGVLVDVEFHKRFDPMYAGTFSMFKQTKFQIVENEFVLWEI